jgi:hypothetical protein
VLDLRRQLAAVGGKLDHDLLVQPDVHGGGIIAVAGVTELLRKLLDWEYARGSVRDMARLGFLVLVSGLIVIVFADGSLAPATA